MKEEQIFKVISTDSEQEFQKWIDYMKANQIDFKARMRNVSGAWKCSLTIDGKTDEEIEQIKEDIGFYFD